VEQSAGGPFVGGYSAGSVLSILFCKDMYNFTRLKIYGISGTVAQESE